MSGSDECYLAMIGLMIAALPGICALCAVSWYASKGYYSHKA